MDLYRYEVKSFLDAAGLKGRWAKLPSYITREPRLPRLLHDEEKWPRMPRLRRSEEKDFIGREARIFAIIIGSSAGQAKKGTEIWWMAEHTFLAFSAIGIIYQATTEKALNLAIVINLTMYWIVLNSVMIALSASFSSLLFCSEHWTLTSQIGYPGYTS